MGYIPVISFFRETWEGKQRVSLGVHTLIPYVPLLIKTFLQSFL